MVPLAYVLIALAHTYFASGITLEKPTVLVVLQKDLEALSSQFPSAESWPESRIIKYSDTLSISVTRHQQTSGELEDKENILVVEGKMTIAKVNRLPDPPHEISDQRDISKLFFKNGFLYFDDPNSEPEFDLSKYYIISYQPPFEPQKEPAIEYISPKEFESELLGFIPKVQFERSVSETTKISTYVRMKNGVKLNVHYDDKSGLLKFKGEFRVLLNSGGSNLVDAVKFETLTIYIYKDSVCIQFLKLGMDQILGVTATPFEEQTKSDKSDLLKVPRSVLLDDVLSVLPTNEPGTENVGVIRYSDGKVVTVNHFQLQTKSVLRLTGKFVFNGDNLYWICLAFPEGVPDQGSVDWYRTNVNSLENTVFFSCAKEDKEDSEIVLKEATEHLELDKISPLEAAVISRVSIEPFIRYQSDVYFLRTLKIFSDAMNIRCAKGPIYRSYRLFAHVFLNYDCEARKAYFDTLEFWFKHGQSDSYVESVSGVVYDSTTGRFEKEDNALTDFKLRQLYPVYPYKIPATMSYMSTKGQYVAIDGKSTEWDLEEMRKKLLNNILPQWGLVRVDKSVLLVIEKSNAEIDGEKKWCLTVKCEVVGEINCNQNNKSDCMREDAMLYDGTKLMLKSNHEEIPSEVYWPKQFDIKLAHKLFSVSSSAVVRYAKFSSFKENMKDLSEKFHKGCESLTKAKKKMTMYMYYYSSPDPIVAYYDCTLNYIFFISDFKIIKLPNIGGVSTSYKPNEETKFLPKGSSTSVHSTRRPGPLDPVFETRDEELRRKYPEYILEDLVYDPLGNVFHSKSMFLHEVYALRLIPTEIRDTTKHGEPVASIVISQGPQVEVY